ncbi:MAG: N-acetylmuramoyl-L-alanine amidase [Rhodocyclaceae bacterium]|nr:MAG: N-acetylmuramoyl-L-alanine amidase [Rhodocyclaceae bacterium]
MRPIARMIIHCAASPNGQRLSHDGLTAAHVIDDWHRARGFKRDWRRRAKWNPSLESIGYHWVIDTDGAVYTGRAVEEIGAHAVGFNLDSVGVCLVGTDAFTPAQWFALRGLVETVRRDWPIVHVLGHRDLPNVAKTCPGFDVYAWDAGSREPVHGHICQEVTT